MIRFRLSLGLDRNGQGIGVLLNLCGCCFRIADDEFRRRCERRDSTVTKKRRAAAAKKAYYYPPDKTRSRWQHVAEAVVNMKW